MNASLVTHFAWRRLPDLARRWSLTLWLVLRDGDYLLVWPRAAAGAPLVAVVLGFAVGSFHPGPTFSYSTTAMALLAVLAAFGSAFGLEAWLAFVVADFLFTDRSSLPGFQTFADQSPLEMITERVLPLILSYLLLAGLLVLAPLLGMVLRLRTMAKVHRSDRTSVVAGLAVQALTQSIFVYFWAQATAFMIRPLWSSTGEAPDIEAIAPLQERSSVLAVLVLVGVLGRGALTLRALGTVGAVPPLKTLAYRLPPRRWPAWLGISLQTGLLVLMLSGLLESLLEAVLVAGVLASTLTARRVFLPRLSGYVKLLGRVPVLARMAAAMLLTYLLAGVVVLPAALDGQSSFAPMMWAIVLSVVLSAALLPVEVVGSQPEKHPSRGEVS